MSTFTAFSVSTCPRCLGLWVRGDLLMSRGFIDRPGGYGITHADCPRAAQRGPDDPFPSDVTPLDLCSANSKRLNGQRLAQLFPHFDPSEHVSAIVSVRPCPGCKPGAWCCPEHEPPF
jgi:hypothetical protein